ncbi:uncharacterized protein [Drosophila pseudoobscura]|uniref:Uncharacterized protein n=1 Tax=Drosophila pseudoobscura pseudoobscura TaxID=46245 RepID=A0A6I8UYZ3_DROPS|nr:uncharacterized protein LOC6902197 [Drosophila pseudoobscura]
MKPATAGAARRQFARRRREQQQQPQQQQQQQERRTRLSPVWNSNWNSEKRAPAGRFSNIAVVRPSSSSTHAPKTPRPAKTCQHPRGMHSFSNPHLALPHGKEQADAGFGKSRNRMPVALSRTVFGRSYTPPSATGSQRAKGRPRQMIGVIPKPAKANGQGSHLCSSSDHVALPLLSSRVPGNKALAESHQQLERLLSGIERESYVVAPPPHPPACARRSAAVRVRNGSRISKGVRRQMGRHPPAPAVSPMLSARYKENDSEEADHIRHLVPLACNPQLLPPAKREALLELISRAEQHDNGIVELLRPSTENSSRDPKLSMFQMLPLSLNESPYSEKIWTECSQELPQQLRTEDERLKEAKILRTPNGQMLLSRTLEEELKDEKMVLNYMEAELKRRQQPETLDPEPLNERQQQAMRERAELDQHKQLVSECRERRRQSHLKKELAGNLKKQRQEKVAPCRKLAKVVPESDYEEEDVPLWSVPHRDSQASLSVQRAMVKADVDPLNELLERRNEFQPHSQAMLFPESEDEEKDAPSPSILRRSNPPSPSPQRSEANADVDDLNELLERRHQFQVHSQAMVVPESEYEEEDVLPWSVADSDSQSSPTVQRSLASVDVDPLNELFEERNQFQIHSQAMVFPESEDESNDTPPSNILRGPQRSVAEEDIDPLSELHKWRYQFQLNSQASCLYKNRRSLTPWKNIASVATKCSLELLNDVLAALNRGSSDRDDSEDSEMSV